MDQVGHPFTAWVGSAYISGRGGDKGRKDSIQPEVSLRLPCYDFTPVTSPAFGIPLLAVKVRTSGVASSLRVTGGNERQTRRDRQISRRSK